MWGEVQSWNNLVTLPLLDPFTSHTKHHISHNRGMQAHMKTKLKQDIFWCDTVVRNTNLPSIAKEELLKTWEYNNSTHMVGA